MGFDYSAEYARWAKSDMLTEAERRELIGIGDDGGEIESRFFAPLGFGTAGLRGVMGLGLNRMNVYLIRQATFALASLICREGEAAMKKGCVICHDCRNNSRNFAVAAAEVMAGSGVHVRIFEDMRPTPELSFAIRRYGAMAGINITASHNTKEYNGYKVYWSDGAQLPPEHAARVADIMDRTDILSDIKYMPYEKAVNEGVIEIIGRETDEMFMQSVINECVSPEVIKAASDKLKLVYTPFHGAGRVLVPEVLRRLGLKNIYCVERQMIPDGNFSTVESPNPENPEGFALAEKLADEVGADILLGTDPDSDRIGVMVRGKSGKFEQISGNQMGVLLIDYIISRRKERGTLAENAAVIKTIVTTDMAKKAAEMNGVKCFETFTGFKFMAEKIKQLEKEGTYKTIFAYEESYGYMIGDFVRDKDAVTAAALMVETAAYYSMRDMSLIDAMDKLYEKYGFFAEKTLNIVMPGVDGVAKRKRLMEALRSAPPREIGGLRVTRRRDYLAGTETDTKSGKEEKTELSGSDVLVYVTEDGSKLAVRPSGTEPKIKMYVLARGESKADCEDKVKKYTDTAKSLADIG